MNKKRQSLWSDLPSELLELIALKLSMVEVARFKSVCSSWNNAARGYPTGPFLMVPSPADDQEQSLQFFSFQEGEEKKKLVFTAKDNLEKLLDNGRCVGSSHGWLIVQDKFANPWLLNFFTGKEIQIPKRETFPHIHSIEEIDDENFEVKYNPKFDKYPHCVSKWFKDLQKDLIQKAVLSTNPSLDKNFKVAIIFSSVSRLAYWNESKEGHKWTVLGHSCDYKDVVWDEERLCAINGQGIVEVWDLKSSVPTRKICVSPQNPGIFEVGFRFDALQLYLACSNGGIFVIARYIGDMVNENGEVVDEADLLLDDDTHPLVCPYRTLNFKVFKLDLIQETLSEVKSLQDQAMIVGGNQTVLLSTKDFDGLKKDSVYFSDNYWDRIDEDYMYGGHDVGIFNLGEGSIEMLCDLDRIEPNPFWVLPV